MPIMQQGEDWVLGAGSAGYKRKDAGICWDALVAQLFSFPAEPLP